PGDKNALSGQIDHIRVELVENAAHDSSYSFLFKHLIASGANRVPVQLQGAEGKQPARTLASPLSAYPRRFRMTAPRICALKMLFSRLSQVR
ncbi:MAG: hypothetical protein RLN70_00790, partial [Rhodospirillaceae bacterium]